MLVLEKRAFAFKVGSFETTMALIFINLGQKIVYGLVL